MLEIVCEVSEIAGTIKNLFIQFSESALLLTNKEQGESSFTEVMSFATVPVADALPGLNYFLNDITRLKFVSPLQGEVLASPLADPRFSFHHPSRSVAMGGYFIGREEGAVGEEKAPFGVSPSLILAALTTSNANDGQLGTGLGNIEDE